MNTPVEARVFRAFGERTLLEQRAEVAYDLPEQLFDKWWLTWFWTDKLLCQVRPTDAAMALFFMAAIVEAGDA